MKKNLTTLLLVIAAVITPIGTWAQQANITGMTITVDGTVYGAGQTAIITPQTTSIIYTVTGENFANLTENHCAEWMSGCASLLLSGWWDIDTENNIATMDMSSLLSTFKILTYPYELEYTNDGSNWLNSGVTIEYDAGLSEGEEAVITGVTITVDGTVYGAGETAIITPQTTSIIYTVTGENFAYLSDKNAIHDGFSSCDMGSAYSWEIDTVNNIAIFDNTPWIGAYRLLTTAVEMRYSNDGQQTWIYSGVFVMYNDGLSEGEEEEAVITGMSVIVDDVEYGAGETAIITPNSQKMLIKVTGENFAYLSDKNAIYDGYSVCDIGSAYRWEIDTVNNIAIFDNTPWMGAYRLLTTAVEMEYSNDGKQTWIYSGVFVMYNDGTTTALGECPAASSESQKLLRNGQLIIIRDGVEYNVMGQQL